MTVQDIGIKSKTAVIIGAGRIGRGFLGEVFHKAEYDIVFIDIDRELVDMLNSADKYTIFKTAKGKTDTYTVSGFRALHTSQYGEVCDVLSREDAIAAVAVPLESLPDVAENTFSIAIARRAMECASIPLDVLVCVNAMSPAGRMRALLDSLLGGGALDYMRGNMGFIDTIVMSMSPDISPQVKAIDPLGVQNNGYPIMRVDSAAFKGPIPDSDMISPCSNMYAEEKRKVYTVNMSHAVLAYVGSAKGHIYAVNAIYDPEVKRVVLGALEESSYGLCNSFGFAPEDMEKWCEEVLDMLDNPLLEDSLARLGADTARKLSVGDRLVGPALLCLRAGKMPINLINAIAHGYLFNISDDPGTEKTQDIVRRYGIVMALEILSGLDIKHPLQNAVLEAYYSAKDKMDEAVI